MSTDKRERQRANRASRMAAAEEAARQRRNRWRFILYGVIAVVVIVGFVAVGVIASNDSDTDGDKTASESEGGAADSGTGDDSADSDTGGDTADSDTGEEGADSGGEVDCPALDGSDGRRIDFSQPQPFCIDESSDYVAVFETSEGEIRVDLDTDSVPGTVNNFVTLARWGYYDDTLIFRTDPSIAIIQGGSPHTDSASDPGPGYTIPDEPAFELGPNGQPVGPYRYVPGQLVMARSAGFDSAGAQFFFTTGPEAALLDGQGTYVVFGTTDEAGLGVLESIIALHEPGGALGGAPSREVVVSSVEIQEA